MKKLKKDMIDKFNKIYKENLHFKKALKEILVKSWETTNSRNETEFAYGLLGHIGGIADNALKKVEDTTKTL